MKGPSLSIALQSTVISPTSFRFKIQGRLLFSFQRNSYVLHYIPTILTMLTHRSRTFFINRLSGSVRFPQFPQVSGEIRHMMQTAPHQHNIHISSMISCHECVSKWWLIFFMWALWVIDRVNWYVGASSEGKKQEKPSATQKTYSSC